MGHRLKNILYTLLNPSKLEIFLRGINRSNITLANMPKRVVVMKKSGGCALTMLEGYVAHKNVVSDPACMVVIKEPNSGNQNWTTHIIRAASGASL